MKTDDKVQVSVELLENAVWVMDRAMDAISVAKDRFERRIDTAYAGMLAMAGHELNMAADDLRTVARGEKGGAE